MRREHADADADADADGQAFTSFEAIVATQSARWKELVDDLSVHVRKGREQLEALMRREHADADADGQAFTSFEAIVATQSARWKELVEYAKTLGT
ncbi:hypothetical protein ATCC90586_012062 [Pythium insidiosum]|nr:hypothetical protein ATCC90586_012062 [Pythium insidiosum]